MEDIELKVLADLLLTEFKTKCDVKVNDFYAIKFSIFYRAFYKL